jgi:hypothetical protein
LQHKNRQSFKLHIFSDKTGLLSFVFRLASTSSSSFFYCTMTLSKLSLALFASLFLTATACTAPLVCSRTKTPPTLDAELSEWASVATTETALRAPLTGKEYAEGNLTAQCTFDDNRIYLALQIPGEFSFSSTDDHLCASIATMIKVGDDATFYNMGGCADALFDGACEETVPDSCLSHQVDIGAHWELSSTEQRVLYGTNTETGEDVVGNKGDEYAYSPYCRITDDKDFAANEWAGAWAFNNATDEYVFELSRSLTTTSASTDAQFVANSTYSLGIAFWDPFESEVGWSDSDHYVTGCGQDWIDLVLDDGLTDRTLDGGDGGGTSDAPTGAPSGAKLRGGMVLAAALVSSLFL